MTIRKSRRPTPGFGIGPPYNPITGERANLRIEGIFPYCAMMQVAASDDYEDYVICRGFDIRINKFIDYEEGNDDKPGISVAKPFGSRAASTYIIGEIYPAFLPTQGRDGNVPPSPTDVDWRLGQNPGAGGHPESLDDTVSQLTDHNNKVVNWMLVVSRTPTMIFGELVNNLSDSDSDFTIDNIELIFGVDPRDDTDDDEETVTVENRFSWSATAGALVAAVQKGAGGTFHAIQIEC